MILKVVMALFPRNDIFFGTPCRYQIDLTRHIQTAHEGVKYAYNQCDYQATHQNNLSRHIQSIHEGVKYGCNQCDKQFTQQSSLTSHIQSIHGAVKYACN